MKKSILVTHAYMLRKDTKQWKTGRPYAPLGALYAAAALRHAGHNVQFFDPMFALDPSEVARYITEDIGIVVICDDSFNYLTKMCLMAMRDLAFAMIRLAKARGRRIVISSSDATDHSDLYLDAGADFIVVGEPEQTIVDLCRSLDCNEPFEHIAGLVYRSGASLSRTKKRALLKDLDSLSLPAWDLVDLSPYKAMWQSSAGYFSINLVTTRGCPYKCNWCAKPVYGNRYTSRSPANVVEELRFLYNNIRFDHVWFCDDIFGLKPGWVQEFALLMQKEPFTIKFKIQSRADLLSREDYVRSLATAGCQTVWLGAESGSQRILDAMEKGITVKEIESATLLLKRHHIEPCFFIQFGYLGETKTDIEQTVQMIHRLMPADIGISVSYPLPGTSFFEKVKADLKAKANWSDSDDLAMLFRNTYHPKFYKRLHRYVHYGYRVAKYRERLSSGREGASFQILTPIRLLLSIVWYAGRRLFEGAQLTYYAHFIRTQL
jgi:anaerobic magnesium-protoporphyrin IX monomethyl ester cyclase